MGIMISMQEKAHNYTYQTHLFMCQKQFFLLSQLNAFVNQTDMPMQYI